MSSFSPFITNQSAKLVVSGRLVYSTLVRVSSDALVTARLNRTP